MTLIYFHDFNFTYIQLYILQFDFFNTWKDPRNIVDYS